MLLRWTVVLASAALPHVPRRWSRRTWASTSARRQPASSARPQTMSRGAGPPSPEVRPLDLMQSAPISGRKIFSALTSSPSRLSYPAFRAMHITPGRRMLPRARSHDARLCVVDVVEPRKQSMFPHSSRIRPHPSQNSVTHPVDATIWSHRTLSVPLDADSGTPRAEIVHHEDLPRLRQLHDTIVSTRQQVAGCTDPDATNFNPVANVRSPVFGWISPCPVFAITRKLGRGRCYAIPSCCIYMRVDLYRTRLRSPWHEVRRV